MKKIRFKKIEIQSRKGKVNKAVFKWSDRKDINIFHFSNGAGKSTLFNIISDIVSYGDTKPNELFTKELLSQNLVTKVELEIPESSLIIYMEREYIQGTQKVIIHDPQKIDQDIVISTKSEYENIMTQILDIPEEVKYFSINKISLGSVLRLNFIDDNSFEKRGYSSYSQCNLINHQHDGITTPLFYYYMFNKDISDTELKSLYELGKDIRGKEAVLKELSKVLEIYKVIDKKKKTVDKDQLNIFDSSLVLEEMYKLETVMRSARYKKFELLDVIEYFQNLANSIKQYKSKSSWYDLLIDEMTRLNEIYMVNEQKIRTLQSKIKERAKQLSSVENFELNKLNEIYKNNKLLSQNVSLGDLNNLANDHKRESDELADMENEFGSVISTLERNTELKDMQSRINSIVDETKEELEIKFSPKSGKLIINSLSDSDNRVARFISVVSLLFTNNINHFGFLFIDSPFIGVNSNRRENILNAFLNKYNTSDSTQLFLFTNKDIGDKLGETLSTHQDQIEYRTGEIKEKLLKITEQEELLLN